MFNILQYSEMECNCAREITEGLFREYIGFSSDSVKDNIHLKTYASVCQANR